MSIPQEAVEAAANALYGKPICLNPECEGCEYERGEALAAIAAALPAIEKEIRAQVATEVRQAGRRTSRCLTFEPDNCAGCAVRDEVAAFAAEIAEGFRS